MGRVVKWTIITRRKFVYYDSYISHKMNGKIKNYHKIENFASLAGKDGIFWKTLFATVI